MSNMLHLRTENLKKRFFFHVLYPDEGSGTNMILFYFIYLYIYKSSDKYKNHITMTYMMS